LIHPQTDPASSLQKYSGGARSAGAEPPFAPICAKDIAMTDPTTRAAEILKGHRESIDRLDAILVFTLAERFKHTQAVGVLKAQHDLPPSDPAREDKQVARLQDLAIQADLDPEFAKKFLNFIIQEVIQHHKQHQS